MCNELKSTIPFRCDNGADVLRLVRNMKEDDIICASRGDELSLCFKDGSPYVIVHTGNLLGMVHDLTFCGYLA